MITGRRRFDAGSRRYPVEISNPEKCRFRWTLITREKIAVPTWVSVRLIWRERAEREEMGPKMAPKAARPVRLISPDPFDTWALSAARIATERVTLEEIGGAAGRRMPIFQMRQFRALVGVCFRYEVVSVPP